MAFLNTAFEAADLPVSDKSFDPLPEGWYSAKISGAELKNTKAGTGQYINVKYDIIGPTHQGRCVFGMLNISNQNPKAEEIGRQQLGELMRAIGLTRVEDTDQLIGGSCQIKLKISKSEGYDPRNDVSGFKASAGAMPSMVPAAPSAPAPAAPSASSPPWIK